MDTTQPNQQNHEIWENQAGIQVTHKQDLYLDEIPVIDVAGLPVIERRVLPDPKALHMFDHFVHNQSGNYYKYPALNRVLLVWLIKNHFNSIEKRLFSLVVALVSLPPFALIMLITAIAIRLESPGPILFKQERVGKWGRRFYCYKFRSMYADAEARKAELMDLNEADEVVFKIKNDPRMTRVGSIIRKLSIDELPQLFNVIKGDMNIVGPRPPIPIELENYPFDTFRRLDVIPGITGLQQVSGRSDLSFKRWVELDIEYIRDQSLMKDIKIIVKTIPTVLSRKGAY